MPEARVGHERVRAHLLLEPPAQVDGLFDSLHLGGGDGVRERRVGHLALLEQRGEPRLAGSDETVQACQRLFRLVIQAPELWDGGEGWVGCAGGRERRPDGLVVGVLARHLEELAAVGQRRLRHGHPAGVQPLPDHLERRDALGALHVRARRVDCGVGVQQRRPWQPYLVEADPGVIQVVTGCLQAHVADGHTLDKLAVPAQVH
mmetsp:Transcript_26905/g.85269  ORF Transcript_26905/g.85269 Transcript_26905/m.85269 type:complete len:204 (-) Transcript_26905:735-1346(-)